MSFSAKDLPHSQTLWEETQRSLEADSIHALRQLESDSKLQKGKGLYYSYSS
jgi:hypothetical protein